MKFHNLTIPLIDTYKDILGQLNRSTVLRQGYIPGSGMSSSNVSSRRSPALRSELDSMQFDLDDDEPTPKKDSEDNHVTKRNCRSVIRGNYKVNNAKVVDKYGRIVSRASNLRDETNISTPESMVIGYRQINSNSHQEDNNSLNRSMYSVNLQSKIDKKRSQHSMQGTPIRKIAPKKLATDSTKDDNFTDISKIKQRDELAPIELKKKLNYEVTQNLPIKSNRDSQFAGMHTSAFLYSKIPNPSRSKGRKTIIVPDATDVDDYDIKATKSTKVSSQNKSVVSSLIATLGQRKRDANSLNGPVTSKPVIPRAHIKERLDRSPHISTENVRILEWVSFFSRN